MRVAALGLRHRNLGTPRIGVAGARRPGRSDTGLLPYQSLPPRTREPQKAQRIEGVAATCVAPIGAGDGIRGATQRGGIRAEAARMLPAEGFADRSAADQALLEWFIAAVPRRL